MADASSRTDTSIVLDDNDKNHRVIPPTPIFMFTRFIAFFSADITNWPLGHHIYIFFHILSLQ
jgi:hypothetical protein